MAASITSLAGATHTYFTVNHDNKSTTVHVPNAALSLKDPAANNISVENSVQRTLLNNAELAVNNPSSAQQYTDVIVDRATANFNKLNGTEVKNEDLDIWSNTGSGIAGVSPPSEQPSPEYKSNSINPNAGFYNVEEQNAIKFPAGDKKSSNSTMTEYQRGYFRSVGGADLAVFYMAEMPVIEDVIARSKDPDSWRKEIIVFELDNVLSISYSTLREKFPVRQLGHANPVAYTYGIRTIAGHIAFAVLAEDVLSRLRSQIRTSFSKASKNLGSLKASGMSEEYINEADKNIKNLENYYTAALSFQNNIQLLDSLLPFHLLIMGVNEAGVMSKFIIKDIYINDETQHQGTQQPHIINKVNYVARDIVPMSESDINDVLTGSISSLTEQFQHGSYDILSMHNLTGSQVLEESTDFI